MRIFWHGRDLRIPDNVGLHAAAREDDVVPVYVYDPERLRHVGTRQRAFWMRGVRALKRAYRARGGDLLVRAGTTREVLADIVEEFDAAAVVHNAHYHPVWRRREHAVAAALDVPVESHVDHVLVDPARLDERYETHSQFHRDWEPIAKSPPVSPPERFVDVADAGVPPVPEVGIDLPPAGYEAARTRFDAFLDAGIRSYSDTRDDLERAVEAPQEAVSRLSPYLAAGMIGIREVWADATEVYDRVEGRERKNVGKYRYELSWREHNYHLLYTFPKLLTENYNGLSGIAWRDDDAAFDAWTHGETGYPLVDAGMRQLEREGYIHNRPRQVVASFLTKHLLIDWRRGARHFARRLVDHDPASNYGNWQWIASTGTDSVDVRIFDPVSQMAKYDENATFVKTYVPELRDVPAETVVEWPTLPAAEREAHAPDYPHPIVDRNDAYGRAKAVYERALDKR